MAQTNLNIRIDEDLKTQFNEVCNAMGLPASTAITLFMRRVIQDRAIPFQIKAVPKPTDTDTNK